MTLPDERAMAVIRTRQFLLDLLQKKFKRVPKEVIDRVYSLLRHYPNDFHFRNPADSFELPEELRNEKLG